MLGARVRSVLLFRVSSSRSVGRLHTPPCVRPGKGGGFDVLYVVLSSCDKILQVLLVESENEGPPDFFVSSHLYDLSSRDRVPVSTGTR